jgi:hypothetical protein
MITNHIPKYVSKGLKDKLWYENQTAEFIKIFGYIRLPLVSKIFAATSINSSLKSNIRLFRKAYHEITNNLPLSNYLPVMKLQLERIQRGEDINGRKIKSFAAALSGDPNAVVVDIWLLRAFDEDKKFRRNLSGREQSSGASNKQYDNIETWVRDNAPLFHSTPRQLSAMIWSGVRTMKSKERETNYIEILRYQMYNMYED